MVIALPELYGPRSAGFHSREHGFIRVNPYGQVPDVGPIYAAGDATSFAIKHGGGSAGLQQADAAAQSIAALAGAPVTPEPFNPGDSRHAADRRKARVSNRAHRRRPRLQLRNHPHPHLVPPTKIAAKYLAPYLEQLDRESAPT